MHYINSLFAQVYGGGTYNSTTYETTTSNSGSGGATGNSGTSSGGTTSTGSTTVSTPTTPVLTDTGFDIALAVTIASVIIFTALLIRFWRKPAAR